MSDAGQVAQAWSALGRQLAACRRAAGLSQERLAALADYSRSTIANVETGRQRVGADFWARCDEVLAAGGALGRGYAEVHSAERSEHEQAAAQARYDSLAVVGGWSDDPAAAGLELPGAGAGDSDVLEQGAVRDPLLVSSLGEALAGHARTAGIFGGRDLMPLMVRHIRFLRAGFGTAQGRDALQLAGVCARYAEFAGWLSQDLGRRGDALFWTDRALEWARQAEDLEFSSYVLMRQSDLAEGHGPAQRVLGLAEAAGRVTGLGPRATALVAQQRAVGHALDDDVAGFERMMDRARDQVTAAVASEDAPWGAYCTPVYLAMQEATGWMQLGRADEAVTVFERQIGLVPAADRVDAGLFQARLAHAYSLSDRADSAARSVLAAFELAEATGSWRARQELALVRRLAGSRPQSEMTARIVAIFDAKVRSVRLSGRLR